MAADLFARLGDNLSVDPYTESAISWLAPHVSRPDDVRASRSEASRAQAIDSNAHQFLQPLHLVDSCPQENLDTGQENLDAEQENIAAIVSDLIPQRNLNESGGDRLAAELSERILHGGSQSTDAFICKLNEVLRDFGLSVEMKELKDLTAAVRQTVDSISGESLGRADYTGIMSLNCGSRMSNRMLVVMSG